MKRHCIQSPESTDPCEHFACHAGWLVRVVVIAVLSGSALWAYAATPPANFPQGRRVEVPRGAPLRLISNELKDDGVIRSALLFEGTVRALGADTGVQAGTYFFEQALSVVDLARRLVEGIFGLKPVRVTIPEGATVRDMGYLFDRRLSNFDRVGFLRLAANKEGYLFPDTYFFLEDTKPEQIIADMHRNFRKHIGIYESQIASSDLTQEELVILASLLEKEARKPDERRVISGIVRNRLEKDMPLQIDATFRYILGKGSFELTLKDLKNDSPYNTYTNTGLPPSPIANPGLDALLAALEPQATKYLYYLHDLSGHIRYARTFAQHRQNKLAYLP